MRWRCFEREKEYFEVLSEFYWKPVDIMKDQGDVVTMADGGRQATLGPW